MSRCVFVYELFMYARTRCLNQFQQRCATLNVWVSECIAYTLTPCAFVCMSTFIVRVCIDGGGGGGGWCDKMYTLRWKKELTMAATSGSIQSFYPHFFHANPKFKVQNQMKIKAKIFNKFFVEEKNHKQNQLIASLCIVIWEKNTQFRQTHNTQIHERTTCIHFWNERTLNRQ